MQDVNGVFVVFVYFSYQAHSALRPILLPILLRFSFPFPFFLLLAHYCIRLFLQSFADVKRPLPLHFRTCACWELLRVRSLSRYLARSLSMWMDV